MEVIPAIDLHEGKVVRLERGDYRKIKVYSDNPREIVGKWEQAGARWIHVVDLEGARDGQIKNWTPLESMLLSKKSRLQFGGGVRQFSDVERLFRMGVDRVILGSKILDPAFLEKVTQAYPDRMAVSLDLRGEEVRIEGWLKGAGKNVWETLKELARYPVACLIVTDIERDGTLSGMNLEKVGRLLKSSPFPIVFSGGASSLTDLRALASVRNKKLEGVIVGKALYEGRFELEAALQAAKGKEN